MIFCSSKHLKQANLRYVRFLFDAVYHFTEKMAVGCSTPAPKARLVCRWSMDHVWWCGWKAVVGVVQRWFPGYPLANEHGNGKWTILKMYSEFEHGDVPASHVSLPEGRCAGCFGGMWHGWMWHGWIEIESGWCRNLVMTTWDRYKTHEIRRN